MKDEKDLLPLRIVLHPFSAAYGGISIGKYNGKIVMIKGAIPCEQIEAKIEGERKDYYIATATEIFKPSPDRTAPRCRHFGMCGGCQSQYISYDRQIKLKEEVLRDCLKRLARIETDLSAPLIHNPWNYRYKGQFKVSFHNNHAKIGFYKERSREVIDIDNCPLMSNEINEHLIKVRNIYSSHPSIFRNIAEIHISCSGAAVALIKISLKDRAKNYANSLSSLFIKEGFSGLLITTDKSIWKYGKPYITLDLQYLKYIISPLSFFQSHWILNQAVVRFIKESLQPLRGKRVLDLYSGAGNFSLPIAVDADEVIAVEENPHAIEDGKINLRLNNIKNCKFIRSSVEALNIDGHFDILIVDPPRLGMTNKAIDNILSLTPERIAYISCNPATFARDLKKLSARYNIESIRMIDFFPQTYHIESLAFLRLR
ncbi:MAG: class I SAM-dependent RNA methyltransferase [Thermodesulfovibrionales bacterium]|nr:class I SAM-dependent RNA methyltransferase [Thermodesulfovibrionales bacterium]